MRWSASATGPPSVAASPEVLLQLLQRADHLLVGEVPFRPPDRLEAGQELGRDLHRARQLVSGVGGLDALGGPLGDLLRHFDDGSGRLLDRLGNEPQRRARLRTR
jgi:hypothetical protein